MKQREKQMESEFHSHSVNGAGTYKSKDLSHKNVWLGMSTRFQIRKLISLIVIGYLFRV